MSYIVSVLDPNPVEVEVPAGSIRAVVLASGDTNANSVSVRTYIPGDPPINVGTYPLDPTSDGSSVFEGFIGAPHTTFRLEVTATFGARHRGGEDVTVITDVGDYEGLPPERTRQGAPVGGAAAPDQAPAGPRPT